MKREGGGDEVELKITQRLSTCENFAEEVIPRETLHLVLVHAGSISYDQTSFSGRKT